MSRFRPTRLATPSTRENIEHHSSHRLHEIIDEVRRSETMTDAAKETVIHRIEEVLQDRDGRAASWDDPVEAGTMGDRLVMSIGKCMTDRHVKTGGRDVEESESFALPGLPPRIGGSSGSPGWSRMASHGDDSSIPRFGDIVVAASNPPMVVGPDGVDVSPRDSAGARSLGWGSRIGSRRESMGNDGMGRDVMGRVVSAGIPGALVERLGEDGVRELEVALSSGDRDGAVLALMLRGRMGRLEAEAVVRGLRGRDHRGGHDLGIPGRKEDVGRPSARGMRFRRIEVPEGAGWVCEGCGGLVGSHAMASGDRVFCGPECIRGWLGVEAVSHGVMGRLADVEDDGGDCEACHGTGFYTGGKWGTRRRCWRCKGSGVRSAEADVLDGGRGMRRGSGSVVADGLVRLAYEAGPIDPLPDSVVGNTYFGQPMTNIILNDDSRWTGSDQHDRLRGTVQRNVIDPWKSNIMRDPWGRELTPQEVLDVIHGRLSEVDSRLMSPGVSPQERQRLHAEKLQLMGQGKVERYEGGMGGGATTEDLMRYYTTNIDPRMAPVSILPWREEVRGGRMTAGGQYVGGASGARRAGIDSSMNRFGSVSCSECGAEMESGLGRECPGCGFMPFSGRPGGMRREVRLRATASERMLSRELRERLSRIPALRELNDGRPRTPEEEGALWLEFLREAESMGVTVGMSDAPFPAGAEDEEFRHALHPDPSGDEEFGNVFHRTRHRFPTGRQEFVGYFS